MGIKTFEFVAKTQLLYVLKGYTGVHEYETVCSMDILVQYELKTL